MSTRVHRTDGYRQLGCLNGHFWAACKQVTTGRGFAARDLGMFARLRGARERATDSWYFCLLRVRWPSGILGISASCGYVGRLGFWVGSVRPLGARSRHFWYRSPLGRGLVRSELLSSTVPTHASTPASTLDAPVPLVPRGLPYQKCRGAGGRHARKHTKSPLSGRRTAL